MKTLLLGAFLLVANGAGAQPVPIEAPWKSATTAELAAKLLPPEVAREVVTHNLGRPIFAGQPSPSVTFFGAPRVSDGFCERSTYYVSGLPTPDRVQPLVELRLGPCPRDTGAIFAHLNPGASTAAAKQALRSLDWAARLARSDAPLSFELSCESELLPDPCGKGARAVLASLPLDKTYMVANGNIVITPTGPGQMLWDVRVTPVPKGIRSIQMIWKVPPSA
jgi:hypothetical protein